MSVTPIKPFLIVRDEHGDVHMTVRETRYNSQGYPWVLATPVDQVFKTAAAARAYATAELGARPGEFASS